MEKCSMTDSEWEERQKTRQLEMEACSKALAVLSSDDAHDLFSKTFNPSFVQKEGSMNSERRAEAAKVLAAYPRLATLAVRVKLDAFTRVKRAIDDMVSALLQEKADEIKHKDFCVEEFNTNELQTEKKTRKKQDLTAKVEDLADQIKQLTSAIDTLKGFYAKKAALLQAQEPAGPPPPAGFSEYKKNAAAGGVMGMIQQIINDAKAMEAEVIRSEEDAQKAYEDFVKE